MGVRVLFKNTLNTFKKKKLQILAIGIIIALSSFLYTTMFYAIDSLKTPLENFINETNQEDFSISMINGLTEFDINNLSDKEKMKASSMLIYTLSDIKKSDINIYNKIIENRINAFEKDYKGFKLENRSYKEVNFKNNGKSNKITLFKDSKNINLSYIEKGNKPKLDNEIAVTNIYAKKNNLDIGDSIDINGKNYIITGFVLFADNTLPISGTDFNIDNSKMTLGLVNNTEYESIKGKEDFYLSGVSNNEESLKNFNEDIIKTYKDKNDLKYITSIVLTKNQMKSGAIYEEIKGGQAMTIGISVSISTIAVLIVLMITYRIVKNEKTQIGVLKALGYSKYEILKPYIMILTIISLPLLLTGYILGVYTAPYMSNFYLEFYLIPSGEIRTNLSVLLVAIVVPLVVIIGLSTILINKMLSKKAINLIKSSVNEKVGKLNKLVSKLLKNAKPQTKFKYSFILANTNKFLVFFLGIVFSSMLIIMSLMMSDFFDKMSVDYYKSVGYVYEGIVNMSKEYPKLNNDDEKFISLPNGIYKEDNINITGIDSDNKLHKVYDKKENDITKKLKDGIVVNNSFYLTYGVKNGESINITINDKVYKEKIVGISRDYGEPKVYMDRNNLSNIITKDEAFKNIDKDDFYTGVYSKDKLDKGNYLSVINKNDILEQTKSMQGFVKVAIYSMIITAVFIAVIVLYVLTTMTVEDNYYSISLLKVMGYSKKEVNSMMLSSYLVYSIISYIISIPITVFGLGFGIRYLASEFGMVMPFEFEIWQGIVGLIIILFIFMLGTYAAKKKIEKISLQEVLKSCSEQ
ncbi:ABC transporter permease [Romboutsia hominis]|uniref:ABC transporter permease n=1 Tax=Romboutsia hominis TaxID=1507512 RepID=UPI000B321BE1|nr:ABC transporter permease [Romboutsia hominis]